ncbi:TetR/AcrR family transcriptional regulator [Amycolatopsis rhabdoformis]|uniref:TetR/AcrR family transcriptional regulator n=1 Tax=Amycolatopsis rhabdoformis TaxID=1448059 RepID=A0ABZ1HXQ1_9PSEU|nr:TetR/AcrR family transcriptional regulator [Amycolatopsis rhabdoformis]WSE26164.1 TetR/AcrR family transcriptional regulator [Amycolatopsis rhabdoformis]
MPPNRTQPQAAGLTAKGRATRLRLLEAAQEQLRVRGSVEIADVAAAADVSPSVIYRYFGNKFELIHAVVTDFYDEYDRSVFLAELQPDSPWLERETLRIEREIDFLYHHPLGPRVAAGLLHEPAATHVDAERQRKHAEMAARNIRRGQKSGELAATIDAELVGASIIGALRAVLAAALSHEKPPPPAKVLAPIAQLSKALLPPASDGK